ncbi:hypothetical protein KVT40_003321 [Elsinoe batatas]|uniref:Uncharacterized protein n=1 Tax=Elsinoe batatas TaxID=2601811 RepID=A0A8K0L3X3_9PEZI|nr:hypothetical protein KVT40_003321 [Elsinoe batatas]
MPVNTTGLRALCWSILYGVDKIPDTWFDKIPYYQSEEAKQAKKSAKRSKKEGRHRRTASVDDKYYEDHYARRSDDRRRRRSYDDEDPDLDDDTHKYAHRRSRDDGRRGNGWERRGYDGAGNGDYAQPRAHRANEYPVNHASVVPQAHPSANGYGYPVNGTAVGSATYNVQQSFDRPPSSGPVPGYVPYSNIYNGSPTQANSPPGDQFGSRRGSIQHNGPPSAHPRQAKFDEPRGYHGRRRDSRYDSDSYDSDDSRRHRRRHRSRDRASSHAGHRRASTWK